jgi:N-acetylglutamate synthase-like GNAT family acetyltransferase
MPTESVVRVATPEDRDQIYDLIRLVAEENGLFPLSERKMRYQVDRFYGGQPIVIGVIGPVGAIEGGIFLSIEEPYYSDAMHIVELFSVVRPEHRKSTHAKALIEFAKHCSDSLKLTLFIGVVSNIRTQAKIRLYERQLTMAGAYFVHNPQFSGAGASWRSEAAE